MFIKYKLGKVDVVLQLTMYSPFTIGKAPNLAFNLAISAFGPANNEVPVSAIA
jgi:hypothetical protein